MATEKQLAIRLASEDMYDAHYKELKERYTADYHDCLNTYWKPKIESGETTLFEYRKIWKKDMFDKEWKACMMDDDLLDGIAEKYGIDASRKIVNNLIKSLCDDIFYS